MRTLIRPSETGALQKSVLTLPRGPLPVSQGHESVVRTWRGQITIRDSRIPKRSDSQSLSRQAFPFKIAPENNCPAYGKPVQGLYLP